ncbi:MAG TPA: hypothetical protein VJH95_06275 [Candidatus Nanoarchaeia archaeon]|nr:hypothetical protein [Candidatus Nanoarchaeia archaeon]
MKVKSICIEPKIQFKIYSKHGVKFSEIKEAIQSQACVLRKTKDGKYIAFTKSQRYLTIVFTLEKGNLKIITAYPSSQWQVAILRRKKK